MKGCLKNLASDGAMSRARRSTVSPAGVPTTSLTGLAGYSYGAAAAGMDTAHNTSSTARPPFIEAPAIRCEEAPGRGAGSDDYEARTYRLQYSRAVSPSGHRARETPPGGAHGSEFAEAFVRARRGSLRGRRRKAD